MGDDSPQHPGYKKFEDTPWITQGREIADIGGKGVLENYNKVNVFDDATRRSIEARNNDIYKRAFDDANREYQRIMNDYAAKNYNQFGSLNSTPGAYRTDMANLQAQRQLDDMAYNKAVNYENLINNELQRRYNTLDMFNKMYQYGQIPHQVDIGNWNVENTNRDISYSNALSDASGGDWFSGALQGATMGMATGNPYAALGGATLGAVGGMM